MVLIPPTVRQNSSTAIIGTAWSVVGLTPVSAGRICVNVDLHTDHDFLALVQNFQQQAVGPTPTPGGSGAISKCEKATDIPSSEESTSSFSSESDKKKSRKRKALKKKNEEQEEMQSKL
ncbi:hypothetical protein GHT06_018419 [Daphnia sinensis]|uniref:Uncharacterized protein n=1 Tax=Daphnia sinensis TaxID=1820382 RepID=A0AAD5PS99_9CRUS|nr:hypothetical protein GHT06_018419 [Daphnia sinensis]